MGWAASGWGVWGARCTGAGGRLYCVQHNPGSEAYLSFTKVKFESVSGVNGKNGNMLLYSDQ